MRGLGGSCSVTILKSSLFVKCENKCIFESPIYELIKRFGIHVPMPQLESTNC